MTMRNGEQRRIAELQRELHEERQKRLKAEQSAAGRKSLILRLQAQLAAVKAKQDASTETHR